MTAESDAGRPLAEVPDAINALEALRGALADRRPAFFLDYDGTLTPIVSRPDLARLSESARTALDGLARRYPVAVVSGRDRRDVEELVGLESVIYAGSHGFDIRLPDGRTLEHEAEQRFVPEVAAAAEDLQKRLRGIDGALVEAKRFSAAAHYRNVAEADVPAFQQAVDAVLADHPGLKRKPGKMVVEVQPDIEWDKGRAVTWLLDALDLDTDAVVPLFFGDDVTDEDAFRALRGRGLGVVVGTPEDEGDRATLADYRVDNPDEVMALVKRLTPEQGS